MVRILKKLKTLTTIFITLILTLALTQNITAQTPGNMQTFFSKDYPGISVKVNATRETIPGENITINLWVNCTADGVYMDYFYLNVSGFETGQKKIPLIVTCIMEKAPLVFNHTSQFNCTVHIPNDVWDAIYAELYIQYTVVDEPFKRNPIFSITIVRNVYLEELENTLKNLNESYQQLNDAYWQLNSSYEQLNETYWDLNQNYTSLNQTYWDLKGSIGGLDTTRNVAIVLAITTVFFAATTIYQMMRKPKQYW